MPFHLRKPAVEGGRDRSTPLTEELMGIMNRVPDGSVLVSWPLRCSTKSHGVWYPTGDGNAEYAANGFAGDGTFAEILTSGRNGIVTPEGVVYLV